MFSRFSRASLSSLEDEDLCLEDERFFRIKRIVDTAINYDDLLELLSDDRYSSFYFTRVEVSINVELPFKKICKNAQSLKFNSVKFFKDLNTTISYSPLANIVESCENLKKLKIQDGKIPAQLLENIAFLNQLEELKFVCVQIENASSFEFDWMLKKLNIDTLKLEWLEDWMCLSSYFQAFLPSTLTTLTLNGTYKNKTFNDNALRDIISQTPHLRQLSIRCNNIVTDRILADISSLKYLQKLDLSGCPMITVDSVENVLQKMTTIKHFYLASIFNTQQQEQLQKIGEKYPHCQIHF